MTITYCLLPGSRAASVIQGQGTRVYGYEFEVNYHTAFDLADLSAKGDPIAKQWIMEGVKCVYQAVVESIRKRVALTAQVSNHVAVLFREPF